MTKYSNVQQNNISIFFTKVKKLAKKILIENQKKIVAKLNQKSYLLKNILVNVRFRGGEIYILVSGGDYN